MDRSHLTQQLEVTVLQFHDTFGRLSTNSFSSSDVERFVLEKLDRRVSIAYAPKVHGRIFYNVHIKDVGSINFPIDTSNVTATDETADAFAKWKKVVPILAVKPIAAPAPARPAYVGQAQAMHNAISEAMRLIATGVEQEMHHGHSILHKAMRGFSKLDASEEDAQARDALRWRAVENADASVMEQLGHALVNQRADCIDRAIADHEHDVLRTRRTFERPAAR